MYDPLIAKTHTAACMLESMFRLQAKLQAACKIYAQLQDTLQALQANACFLMHF